MVKGVLDVEDAVALKETGVDAVQVSSHGARQLESAPSPFALLPEMRAALGPEYPIFFDSGLRSGEDALKALHAGADYVFFGRIEIRKNTIDYTIQHAETETQYFRTQSCVS